MRLAIVKACWILVQFSVQEYGRDDNQGGPLYSEDNPGMMHSNVWRLALLTCFIGSSIPFILLLLVFFFAKELPSQQREGQTDGRHCGCLMEVHVFLLCRKLTKEALASALAAERTKCNSTMCISDPA